MSKAKKKPTEVKNLKNEIWKKVKKYNSSPKMFYLISDKGRLKSINKKTKDQTLLKGGYTKSGYYQFNYKVGTEGDKKSFYMHREVAKLFLPKPKKDQEVVIHLDRNKKNNKAKNLIWASRTEWGAFHRKHKSFAYGPDRAAANAKLTIAKVKAIKKSLRAGRKTKTFLANKYKVSIMQIVRIAKGENWGYVSIDD